MQRLDWSLSRLVTQDIKTQPQINQATRLSLTPVQNPLTRMKIISNLYLLEVDHPYAYYSFRVTPPLPLFSYKIPKKTI